MLELYFDPLLSSRGFTMRLKSRIRGLTILWPYEKSTLCHARLVQCQIYAALWPGGWLSLLVELWSCHESSLDAAVSPRDYWRTKTHVEQRQHAWSPWSMDQDMPDPKKMIPYFTQKRGLISRGSHIHKHPCPHPCIQIFRVPCLARWLAR